jgi:uncharacterized alkaline shock family protein YloU
MSDDHVIGGTAGAISIPAAVLAQIVQGAAESVDGARVRRPRRGVELELAAGRVQVGLQLAARYGAVLPELAREVQERVSDALRSMCGLEVDAVDVRVEELDGA